MTQSETSPSQTLRQGWMAILARASAEDLSARLAALGPLPEPETLRAVIERFVMREGTDYGARDVLPLESKVKSVMRQLERGDVVVVFDPATGSTNIVPADSAPAD